MIKKAIAAIGAIGIGSGESNNYDDNWAKKAAQNNIPDIGSKLNGTDQVAYVSNPLGAIGSWLNGSQGQTQSTASGIQA